MFSKPLHSKGTNLLCSEQPILPGYYTKKGFKSRRVTGITCCALITGIHYTFLKLNESRRVSKENNQSIPPAYKETSITMIKQQSEHAQLSPGLEKEGNSFHLQTGFWNIFKMFISFTQDHCTPGLSICKFHMYTFTKIAKAGRSFGSFFLTHFYKS